jgi:hypothetical protein
MFLVYLISTAQARNPVTFGRDNFVQTARKPNFVLDDHSSRPCLATWLKQPTRGFRHLANAKLTLLNLSATGRHALIA